MKIQTKINILVAIETTFCLLCAILPAAILLPGAWAFMALPMGLMGMATSIFLGVFITRRLLGLNWKDSWAHFKTH